MVNNQIVKQIIKELRETDLPFTKNVFVDENGYCAMGVLVQNTNPNKHLKSSEYWDIIHNTYERLNMESENDYRNNSHEYQSVDITFPNGEKTEICSVHDLIITTNNKFSNSHKETADILEKLTEKYDLDTGVEK